MPLTTTLNEIRAHYPCLEGWSKLLKSLGKTGADDEPLPLRHVLESNGVDDFLWCMRVLPKEYENAIRLLACDIAERASRLVPKDEPRPRMTIDAARLYAKNKATYEELITSGDSAWRALDSAESDTVHAALSAAAWAASQHIADAVEDVAWNASQAAAEFAARAAEWAIDQPSSMAAERTAQAEICRRWLAQFDGETE